MDLFFNFLTHALIIAGCIGLFVCILFLIGNTASVEHAVLRVVAAVVGSFTYIGARALGVSIPGLLLQSIQITNPMSYGMFSILVPSAAGVIVAWILTSALRGSADKAQRIIILILSFIVVLFGDTYSVAYSVKSGTTEFQTSLIPNLTFILSLGLYLVLRYEPKKS